mmetsp:Transcript_46901/g.123965  ORF Transcript_46901/g.123965 Transcript_46901/m.123965 type:complete len:258 (+) Transcript_46901:352-1125(+)
MAVLPDPGVNCVVVVDVQGLVGRERSQHERVEGRLAHDLQRSPKCVAVVDDVFPGGEEVRVDERRRARVAGGKPYRSTTGRAHGAGVRLIPVGVEEVQLPDHASRDEVELHVRMPHSRRRADEATHLKVVRGRHASAEREPGQAGMHRVPGLPEEVLGQGPKASKGRGVRVQRGVLREELRIELQVVLQILPHLRQVVAHLDVVRPELFLVTDAAEHQQLGGGDSAGAEDHLLVRHEAVDVPGGVDGLHPDGARTLE